MVGSPGRARAFLRRGMPLFAALTVLLATAGLAYAHAGSQEVMVPKEYESKVNPYAGNADSIERGRGLYRGTCASCHGNMGNEVEKVRFNDPDFMREMSDPALFYRISEGVPDTKMKAFKDLFTENGRWDLVNFLRSLPAAGATGAGGGISASPAPATGSSVAGTGGANAQQIAGLAADRKALEAQVADLRAAAARLESEKMAAQGRLDELAQRTWSPATVIAALAGLTAGAVVAGLWSASAKRAVNR